MDVHGGWWGGVKAVFDALPVFDSEYRCVCVLCCWDICLRSFMALRSMCVHFFVCV